MKSLLALCVLLSSLVASCSSTPDVKTAGERQMDPDRTHGASATGNSAVEKKPEMPATPLVQSNTFSQPRTEPAGVPRGISIHSTGVKKMERRYRYFFGAYNNTDETFVGQIEINYDTDLMQDMLFASEALTIYANSGGSLYFDRRTAPYYTGEHGAAAVRRFSYKLTDSNGKQLAAETIPLSTQYSLFP